MVQPVALPNLLRFNHNSTGILEAAGTLPKASVRSFSTETFPAGGFWSLGTIDRLMKADKTGFPLVREHQALVALPEGPIVFIDQCQALSELSLARNGALGMRLAADIYNDCRVNLTIDGKTQAFGQHPERNTWHDLGVRSLVVEGRMAIDAAAGEGTFQLLQRRQRPADRGSMIEDRHDGESLVSHALYFGPAVYDPPRKVAPGEWFRNVVLVLRCDEDLAAARPTASVTGGPPCMAIHLPEAKCIVAINFAEDEQTTDSPAGRISVAPRSVRVVAK
jgi:hypothetical protein